MGNAITGVSAASATGKLLSAALLYMAPMPTFHAFNRLHEGLLLGQKCSSVVSFSALADISAQARSCCFFGVVVPSAA